MIYSDDKYFESIELDGPDSTQHLRIHEVVTKKNAFERFTYPEYDRE
jgi:hypothetical protein